MIHSDQFDEINQLDNAIKNCQILGESLQSSINHVRRLNIKFNTYEFCESEFNDIINRSSDSTTSLTSTGSTTSRKSGCIVTPVKLQLRPSTSTPIIGSGSESGSVKTRRSLGSLHRTVSDINLIHCKLRFDMLKIHRDTASQFNLVQQTINRSVTNRY